jgi:hypothetical protein
VTDMRAGVRHSSASVGSAPGAEDPCTGCLGADPGNRLQVAQREYAGANSGQAGPAVLGLEARRGKRVK